MIKKLLAVLGLMGLILGGTSLAWSAFSNVLSSTGQSERPQETAQAKTDTPSVSLKDQDPISVLFVGSDYGEDEIQRSDTIMVATLNPEKETTTLTSIPRDTWVPTAHPDEYISKKDTEPFDKINHSYNDGLGNTQQAVEHFLGIPIHYSISIDIQGVEKIIDALGGLELTPDQTFTQYGTPFVEGETTTFTGTEVMNYVRMRKQDPKGDMGRQQRQRQVLKGLANQFGLDDALLGSMDLLDIAKDHIQTNVDVGTLMQLYRHYQPSLHTVESIPFTQYRSLHVDGVSYIYIPDFHRHTIHKTLEEQLELNSPFQPIVYPAEVIVNQNYDEEILSQVEPGYVDSSQPFDNERTPSTNTLERNDFNDNDL